MKAERRIISKRCVLQYIPVEIFRASFKFFMGDILKVPKCEIFDRSDFHDIYSIKPFWVGDFGAKIETCYLNLGGS